jgi:hypothetical protein
MQAARLPLQLDYFRARAAAIFSKAPLAVQRMQESKLF